MNSIVFYFYTCKFCKEHLFNDSEVEDGPSVLTTNFIFAEIGKSNIYIDSYKRVHCNFCGHIIGDFRTNILNTNKAARFHKNLVIKHIKN